MRLVRWECCPEFGLVGFRKEMETKNPGKALFQLPRKHQANLLFISELLAVGKAHISIRTASCSGKSLT